MATSRGARVHVLYVQVESSKNDEADHGCEEPGQDEDKNEEHVMAILTCISAAHRLAVVGVASSGTRGWRCCSNCARAAEHEKEHDQAPSRNSGKRAIDWSRRWVLAAVLLRSLQRGTTISGTAVSAKGPFDHLAREGRQDSFVTRQLGCARREEGRGGSCQSRFG